MECWWRVRSIILASSWSYTWIHLRKRRWDRAMERSNDAMMIEGSRERGGSTRGLIVGCQSWLGHWKLPCQVLGQGWPHQKLLFQRVDSLSLCFLFPRQPTNPETWFYWGMKANSTLGLDSWTYWDSAFASVKGGWWCLFFYRTGMARNIICVSLFKTFNIPGSYIDNKGISRRSWKNGIQR